MKSWGKQVNMLNTWGTWKKRINVIMRACERINGDCRDVIISEPATIEDVNSIERELGILFPKSFRQVLTEFSAHIEVAWFLDEKKPPEMFREIFCGNGYWDVTRLLDLEKVRQSWIKNVFPNPQDPYDRIWHNKLAFHDVGNGDMITLDLNVETDAPVVYLSHEGDDFHGTILGKNFIDFVDKWSLLGFVGAESWQFQPFINSKTDGLEPNSENANAWRKWLGLEFDEQ
jgi:hypothetical protein